MITTKDSNFDCSRSSRSRPPMERWHLLLVMVGLVLLGGCNFVLLKVLYTAYGDKRAFFVNQAINLLYIVYGGLVLYPRQCFTNEVTSAMTKFPKRHFAIMGFLDSVGTFLTCLGAAYTPGSLTPLLNQLLIPFTMVISTLYLRVQAERGEVLGAVLIVLGASSSLIPSIFSPSPEDNDAAMEVRWYAVLFYALSNVPMAASSCYKEGAFENEKLDVWYLTQWVSIFQFLISFAYTPLLMLPGFSSRDGMTMNEVVVSFNSGFTCFKELEPECAEKNTFALLVGYCAVNVLFNTLGLYLTKHGSAVLNALSYSILLPFTTMLFFTPLLGEYQEPLTGASTFTFTGLMTTLLGFAVYQRYATQVAASPTSSPTPAPAKFPTPNNKNAVSCVSCTGPTLEVVEQNLLEPLLAPPRPSGGQPSFQERVTTFQPIHAERRERARSNTFLG